MAAQSATAPFTCRWSAVSNRTLLPMGITRGERTPHPCVFTTSVWHCSRNATCGSRLLMCTGICQRTRVLRLIACLSTVGATDKWLPLTYSAAAERSPGLHRYGHIRADQIDCQCYERFAGINHFGTSLGPCPLHIWPPPLIPAIMK